VEILIHSVHYIDLIRSFLGNPRGVYAKTVKHPKSAKLASTRTSIILDYGNTVRANISTNHGHEFGLRHQESYVKWEGTKGAIKARLGLLLNYPKGETRYVGVLHFGGGQSTQWQNVPLEGTWFPDGFIGTMASVDAIRQWRGRWHCLRRVDDAIQTMALVEAAYQSSAAGATPIPSIT